MWAYILKRLLLMIPTLLGILLVTFIVIQFVPGGPVEQMVAQLQGRDTGGESAAARGAAAIAAARAWTRSAVEEIKKLYGFDKPAHERFFQMLGQFARFDLGNSFFHNKDVWELIKEKLPVSISLGLWTFFLSYLISVPLGIAKAVRAGTRFDTVTTLDRAGGLRHPRLRAGRGAAGALRRRHVRAVVSAARAHLVELARAEPWGKVVDYLWHIALPVTAMVLGSFAVITMLTKNAVPGGDPQAVRADGARQGAGRAQGAVEARLPQRADPDHHRLSGGLHRRVLHRLAADRDAVLARRPGPALLRVA